MGKRVLVIRFSSIGDIILTSPVVRCLKRQLPGAEVHFLTKKQFEPLLAANPHVDKTWLYDGDFSAILPGLKTAGFDFIIDLHRNLRSQYIRFRLGTRNQASARCFIVIHPKSCQLSDFEKW